MNGTCLYLNWLLKRENPATKSQIHEVTPSNAKLLFGMCFVTWCLCGEQRIPLLAPQGPHPILNRAIYAQNEQGQQDN